MGPGTKTGITVGLMPGVRIGAGCFIGPHVLVSNDLEPGKAVFKKQDLITMESWITLDTDRTGLKEKIGKKE
jgi:acetyltransferase-like isoleucine patch superfamily enzyme